MGRLNPYRSTPPCTCELGWVAEPLPPSCAPCTHIERYEPTRDCAAHPRRMRMPPPPMVRVD